MTTFLDIDWEYMYAELELESKELLKKNKQLKDENEKLKLENEILKRQLADIPQQPIMPQPWTQPPVSPWTQPPVSPWTQPKSPYGEPYVFPGVYYNNGNTISVDDYVKLSNSEKANYSPFYTQGDVAGYHKVFGGK